MIEIESKRGTREKLFEKWVNKTITVIELIDFVNSINKAKGDVYGYNI